MKLSEQGVNASRISRSSDARKCPTHFGRTHQEGPEVQQVGKNCLRQEVSEGQEGEPVGEAWIQDGEGQVWDFEEEQDPQEQARWW